MAAGTRERERTVGLSRTSSGRVIPSAWARAGARLRENPLIGWGAALGLGLLAFLLRLKDLGTPAEFSFDETYYAKDAWSLLHFGYAQNYVDGANDAILNGNTGGQWTGTPEIAVHPEVGKWLIAAGEHVFGMTPFGWRIAACVVGSLMVVVMVRFVRRLSRSTLLGIVAGLLLSLDGLHFVLSRLALLDIFLAFFVLCAVHCLVADREWYRRRMAARIERPYRTRRPWGPVLLLRPWLLASGVCWGLAIGTKWTGLYLLAAFGLLCVAWSAGMRRSFGVRLAWLKTLLVDGVPAFLHLVVVALVVYVATWTPWMMHASVFEEHLSSTQYTRFTGEGSCDGESYKPTNLDEDARWATADQPDAQGLGEVRQSLHTLWLYHRDVYTFHTHFLNCATHDYASHPAGWLVLNGSVGVNALNEIHPPGWVCPPETEQSPDGCPKPEEVTYDEGCHAEPTSSCLRQVILLGTPVLWWGGALALLAALVLWLGGRDWRLGVAVTGAVSSWAPWLLYADRPVFSFYTIVTLPFVVLAITLLIGRAIGVDGERLPPVRRMVGVVAAGAFVVLVLVNFAWFWPVYTNGLLTRSEWLDRIWLDRWI